MDAGQFAAIGGAYLVLMIGNDFAVSAASTRSGGSLPVHPACIVCLSEGTKALLSFAMWMTKGFPLLDEVPSASDNVERSGGRQVVAGMRMALSTISLMLLPAAVYSVNNMLSFFALSRIHIAHVAILRPTGVAVFNCLLWLLVFGRNQASDAYWERPRKICGISLCIVGGLVNSYDFRTGGLSVELYAGLLLFVSTFLSAFGAVANEFVLKYRLKLSIDLQNLCLYFLTFSFTLVIRTWSGGSLYVPGMASSAVRVVVVYNAVMGLTISRILKHMGSLSKMVLGIVREPLEVMIAPLFVASELNISIVCSAAFTVVGGLLYFLPQAHLKNLSGSQHVAKSDSEI